MLLGGSHGPQPGHAGCFSLLAGFGREIYFCLDGPTGSSVSIKGPESSSCSSLCTRANNLNQVRARNQGEVSRGGSLALESAGPLVTVVPVQAKRA